jgi:hypothetical protein
LSNQKHLRLCTSFEICWQVHAIAVSIGQNLPREIFGALQQQYNNQLIDQIRGKHHKIIGEDVSRMPKLQLKKKRKKERSIRN